MFRSRRGLWAFALGIFASVGLAAAAITLYRNRIYIELPDYPPVSKVYWLDQGWDDKLRERFHHADQGTQTLGIPYEWFVALEQPRIALVGDVGRLNDPVYLDRFGFIPGATIGGETPPPVGFAKSVAATMVQWDGRPWTNPQTDARLHAIGFTCAACHTGRLTYGGEAVIIDGAPALIDLEKFRQAIGISILFTDWIPGRFDRFARNVLGEGASGEAKRLLREQVHDLWDKRLNVLRKLDKSVSHESVAEGYGRLDALNRIGNQVFALDLGPDGVASEHRNYRGWSAPVSYPHLWTTPHFDWVQYNASIMQPMVRNAGQALGVGAPLQIARGGDGLYGSDVQIQNLFAIEQWLSGELAYPDLDPDHPWPRPGQAAEIHHPRDEKAFRGLRAPSWPAHVLGTVDIDKAARGLDLYRRHCQECHRPPIGTPEFWSDDHWETAADGRSVLKLVTKTAAAMDTDAAQAKRMKDRMVWVPAYLDFEGRVPGAIQPFAAALGGVVERAVAFWYDRHEPVDRARMSGDRPNGLQAEIIYKARPLDGVWATAPFLHNGSVPSVYALLSPPDKRPGTFQVGRRDYDPDCLGYHLNAVPWPKRNAIPGTRDPEVTCLDATAGAELNELEGLFEFDTRRGLPKTAASNGTNGGDGSPAAAGNEGNANTGHAFVAARDSDRASWMPGVIGYALEPEDRAAIIAFLKTDCVNGRASEKVGEPDCEACTKSVKATTLKGAAPVAPDTSCPALQERLDHPSKG